jgi:hypothetical protein
MSGQGFCTNATGVFGTEQRVFDDAIGAVSVSHGPRSTRPGPAICSPPALSRCAPAFPEEHFCISLAAQDASRWSRCRCGFRNRPGAKSGRWCEPVRTLTRAAASPGDCVAPATWLTKEHAKTLLRVLNARYVPRHAPRRLRGRLPTRPFPSSDTFGLYEVHATHSVLTLARRNANKNERFGFWDRNYPKMRG